MIAGGEPLLRPEIDVIAKGMVERKKFVYLCANAILLEKNLDRFTPSPYLTFNVHLDALRETHDKCGDRESAFDKAVGAIKAAKSRGFRVNTNTTVFDGEDPKEFHQIFDTVMGLSVDRMRISPGYSYAWAPDEEKGASRSRRPERLSRSCGRSACDQRRLQSCLQFPRRRRDLCEVLSRAPV